MPFSKEPPYAHGQAAKTAVLFCNLGTPDAPTPKAVRRYLAEFLSDHRVVEIPRLLWMLILHGIILRFRPAKSAAKYASVWTAEGSPLKIWTEKQAALLQSQLTQLGHHVVVRWAMRYGSTSIASQLDVLKADGVTRILVLPAYPQYSATTTASVFDAVYMWAQKTRSIPELRFVNHYHDDAKYIAALSSSVSNYWQAHGQPDKLVMSFHGVPERTLHLGDIYHCECFKTARLLAQSLGLSKDQYQVTFHTEPTLIAMGKAGVGRVDVICPGFTSDCLETLEEINMEAREAFLHAGGKAFHYITCLNDSPLAIDALAAVATQHLSGWDTHTAPDVATLAHARAEALALGAKN
ncbi:MAG: hypothetical protein RLZZ454_1739 [Pseudomonadota bacterium]